MFSAIMVLENVVFCPTHFVSGPKQFDKECRYDVSGVRDSHGQCPVTSSDGKQLGTGTTERESIPTRGKYRHHRDSSAGNNNNTLCQMILLKVS